MLITHTFFKCLHCQKEIEVLDDDYYRNGKGQIICDIECPYCGYENDILNDNRIEIYEREF
jgi:DNA-directed RNA polymerase subunit RPC12/RpoP